MHPALSTKCAFLLWHGLTSATRHMYSTGQRQFLDFIKLHPRLANSDGAPLPATQLAIMEWVSELGFRPVQPTTIKQYLCHIHSLHIDNDLPFDACEGPQVQRLIRGIKRYFSERDRNPVLPITIDILRHIVVTIHPATSVEEATFDAVVKTAFSAFLRFGKFTEKSPGTAGGADSSMKLA